jgi:hypothetical protein
MSDPMVSVAAQLQKAKPSAMKKVDNLVAVEKLISTLTAREQQIVRMRHGLGSLPPHTFTKIGEVVGLSKDRVSKIERRAFRKLRWIVDAADIDDDAALDEFLQKEFFQKQADEERIAEAAERDREQKRRIKDEKYEIRLAKARTRGWKRRLQVAEAEHQAISDKAVQLQGDIARMERRGWLARTVLPHQSRLAVLREDAAQLVQALEVSASAIRRIRAAEPPVNQPEVADNAEKDLL